jgi:methylphosphotriester-DNA--protein-cysteine methyltransferase
MLADRATCFAALLARTRDYDGRLYAGFRATGIYCRPVCPSRPPKPENCRFYLTAAEVVAASFRDCKRCRPDAASGSPAWSGADARVSRSLTPIDAGAASSKAIGDRLGPSERQVRQLFARHVEVPLVVIAQAQRLAAAVIPIDAGVLPLDEVAPTSSFGTISRFNEAFGAVLGEIPGARRRRAD